MLNARVDTLASLTWLPFLAPFIDRAIHSQGVSGSSTILEIFAIVSKKLIDSLISNVGKTTD